MYISQWTVSLLKWSYRLFLLIPSFCKYTRIFLLGNGLKTQHYIILILIFKNKTFEDTFCKKKKYGENHLRFIQKQKVGSKVTHENGRWVISLGLKSQRCGSLWLFPCDSGRSMEDFKWHPLSSMAASMQEVHALLEDSSEGRHS